MNIDIPLLLKIMVAAISVTAVVLMGWLTVKIYRDEARPENKNRKKTGW